MPAKYPLPEVKRYVEAALKDPKGEKVWFSAPPKSFLAVVKAFQKRGKFITEIQAQEYIFREILALTADNFKEQRAGQWGDPALVIDQYGIRKDGIPWLIKFFIDKDATGNFLQEISFHPSDRDMTLENGQLISKEWDPI